MRESNVSLDFKPKLLVVDDEPVLVRIITEMLAQCGYEIRHAYDGDEAVSIAKEFRPDCIVTGIMMPRMNGLSEAVAILQFLPDCKFIFVSGASRDTAIRNKYIGFGWDLRLLLSKPFERAELLAALALAGFVCAGTR